MMRILTHQIPASSDNNTVATLPWSLVTMLFRQQVRLHHSLDIVGRRGFGICATSYRVARVVGSPAGAR